MGFDMNVLLAVALGTLAIFVFALAIVSFLVGWRLLRADPDEYMILKKLTGGCRNAFNGNIVPTRASAAEGRTTGGYLISKEGVFRSQHKISDREIERLLRVDKPHL